jgi:D-alanyl-lipoteichoic acid acyltransferase DltB (MBOAT superfamily)
VTFNSVEFLTFLLAVLGLYWLLPVRRRNALLLVASYVFYGWWDWRFLGLIALSTLVDFTLGIVMSRLDDGRRRSAVLGASLAVNLGLLGAFKYANFFIDSGADFLESIGIGASRATLTIVLPVGISFYTFQTISYSFDVYRRRIRPTRNLIDFGTYVAYFPQLVAGPIERAQRLLPLIEQPEQRRFPRGRQLDRALSLIVTGLFKKIVLADGVATFVDQVYGEPGTSSAIAIIAAGVGFSVQVYGDFSGYTDIARGVSELFGIELMVNFREPYLSRNITEVWRRWHISLSDWLRDYLYISLGGNRGGELATARNLMITMLLGGLWHGASWNYVVWGGISGLLLVVHRWVFGGRVADDTITPSQIPLIAGTFCLWAATMLVFRGESMPMSIDMFIALTRWTSGTVAWGGVLTVVVAATAMFWLDVAQRRVAIKGDVAHRAGDGGEARLDVGIDRAPVGQQAVLAGSMIASIVLFSGGSPLPFIYFQF